MTTTTTAPVDTLAAPSKKTRGNRQPKRAQHNLKAVPVALQTLQEDLPLYWGELGMWPPESLHYALEIAEAIIDEARARRAIAVSDLQGPRAERVAHEVQDRCLAAVTDKSVNLSLPSAALDPAKDAARLARNTLVALHSTARYLVDAEILARSSLAELPAPVAPKTRQQRNPRPMHDDEIALANIYFFAVAETKAVPIAIGYGLTQSGGSVGESAVTSQSDLDHPLLPDYVTMPGRGVHQKRTLALDGFARDLVHNSLDRLREAGQLREAITGGSVIRREIQGADQGGDEVALPGQGKRDWYDTKEYDDACSRLQTNFKRHLDRAGIDDQAINATSIQTWKTMQVLRSQGHKAAMDHHFGPGPHNGARHIGFSNELHMDFADFGDLEVIMATHRAQL